LGNYMIYAIDSVGNVSNGIAVKVMDVTAPVISVAADSVGKGTAFAVTADDTCTAYIVPAGTATNDIVASAAYSVVLSSGVAGDLATDTLTGNYMIYAIDSVGNVSNGIAVKVTDPGVSVSQTNLISFAIVPNPASGAIQIEGVSNGTFNIFNIAGQRVLEGPINSNVIQVNISGLTPGAYIVRVASGDMIGVERLIVK
ncbi:MAG: T9SS type A sorting domain-containing protein, partial [Bacteroidales bacterium]|nr:T9SS type A sorting domain-containing protein [Bacteroidales bacterium]